ncbi:hypothetical protein T492DRAFT_413864, partial [Pavlovales sp. CCMP2436]
MGLGMGLGIGDGVRAGQMYRRRKRLPGGNKLKACRGCRWRRRRRRPVDARHARRRLERRRRRRRRWARRRVRWAVRRRRVEFGGSFGVSAVDAVHLARRTPGHVALRAEEAEGVVARVREPRHAARQRERAALVQAIVARVPRSEWEDARPAPEPMKYCRRVLCRPRRRWRRRAAFRGNGTRRVDGARRDDSGGVGGAHCGRHRAGRCEQREQAEQQASRPLVEARHRRGLGGAGRWERQLATELRLPGRRSAV